MIERQLECLRAAGIEIIPAGEIATHSVLEREGFVVLVERAGEGFGRIGSVGRLTDSGFAALVWRGDDAFFVARNFEQPATPEQVAAARAFSEDVKNCCAG